MAQEDVARYSNFFMQMHFSFIETTEMRAFTIFLLPPRQLKISSPSPRFPPATYVPTLIP